MKEYLERENCLIILGTEKNRDLLYTSNSILLYIDDVVLVLPPPTTPKHHPLQLKLGLYKVLDVTNDI